MLLDLAHQGGEIEVDTAGWDFSGCEIVLVEGAAGNLDGFVGGGDVGEGAFVYGLKAPFDRDELWGVGQVAGGMDVAWKPVTKGTTKLSRTSAFPLSAPVGDEGRRRWCSS